MPPEKSIIETVMPLGEHLEELRTRVAHALYGLLPIVVTALVFGKQILNFLLQPLFDALDEAGFGAAQATGPLETFGAYVKVSVIAAVIVGGPWILWQGWKFIAPGLYDREKRFVYVLLPLSTLLTTAGIVFLYKVVVPSLLSFLLLFSADIGTRTPAITPIPEGVAPSALLVLQGDPPAEQLKPGIFWVNTELHQVRYCVAAEPGAQPVILTQSLSKESAIRQDYRVTEYINLLLSLLLAFAISFQTPVVILVLGWAGIVTTTFLSKYRKHAVFITAVAAAILTPGDIASMLLLWIPMYLLYELGTFLLLILPAHRIAGPAEGPDAAA